MTTAGSHMCCNSFRNAALRSNTIRANKTTCPPPRIYATADIGHGFVGEKITLLEFRKE